MTSWRLQEVKLDQTGYDINGWYWGLGERLWHLCDGVDSLTIRAATKDAALAIAKSEGWPPRRTGRFNWGRELTS